MVAVGLNEILMERMNALQKGKGSVKRTYSLLLCYIVFNLEIKVGKLSIRFYTGKTKPVFERIGSL